ncbi:hypothetical protein EN742_17900 [Mesorhizobium sp. M4A.F.Ca.ET.020.02.1.1]|nr:hypothetical protein EOA33_36860 [Mesorhizobium sp. M4A.F.Ca.ET.050.02.1.1]RVD38404.1 hypothetical protein EN742_17900 [Mesorhizobium sp. M4A.F.Ca.ET.020.02.1.1]
MGRDQAGKERHGDARHRPRRVFRAAGRAARAALKAPFSPFTGRRCRQADEGRRECRCFACNPGAAPHPVASRPPSPRKRGEGR